MRRNSHIDSFEAYLYEDVLFCNTDDVMGGLSDSEIYYCYQPFIASLNIPNPLGSNEQAGTIRSISCKPYRGFKKMNALVETPSLDSDYTGSNQISDTSEFSAFLMGNRAELIGLSRKLRDRPFTLIVKDSNGKKFLIGTLQSPAYLQNFKITSGKKFDDNCGAEIKFRSNTVFYEFSGEIPFAASHYKDFDADFDSDFY